MVCIEWKKLQSEKIRTYSVPDNGVLVMEARVKRILMVRVLLREVLSIYLGYNIYFAYDLVI